MEAKLNEMDQFEHPELSAAEYVDADIDFHLFIAHATHNPLLIRLYREVSEQMRQRVWLTAAHPVVERRASQYQGQHREVFEAIRNGEATTARRLMRAHLLSIRANLQSISEITSEHPASQ